MIYHYPYLSRSFFGSIRISGAGLGNHLLTYSRAFLGSHKQGGKLIEPPWTQIKLGPILRKEKDWRTYYGIFKRRSLQEQYLFIKMALTEKVHENDASEINTPNNKSIIYSGNKNFFHDFTDADKPLIKDLILSRRIERNIRIEPSPLIVHIRLGDFIINNSNNRGESFRIAFDWYNNAIDYVKSKHHLARNEVTIISDGDPNYIRSFIRHKDVRILRDETGNALDSILFLSSAKYIIASRSTFSMWGAYLGNTETFWDKDFDLESFFKIRPEKDFFL